MKVLFLQDDFPPYAKGGAGIVVASMVHGLMKQEGIEVTVVTAVQDLAQAGSFQENGIHIERIYSKYPQRWRSWRSLYNPSAVRIVKRILAEVKPDIVHAHNVHYYLSYWTLYLARKSGASVFLTAHDAMLFHYGKLSEFTDQKNISNNTSEINYRISPWQQFKTYRFWYNPFRNIIIQFLLRNVKKIFSVSKALKEALEQNGIKNVEVLYNGIDVSAWQVSSQVVEAFISKYGLEGKKVILFGGRISYLKGGDVILKALREIAQVEPEIVLLLLGKRGSYVENLERQAVKWGIGEHLISTGWLSGDELRATYYTASVIVVPSLYLDPLPTIVLEAMACSKPVVGSCFGGISEMIVNNTTGYIANPYNSIALVNHISELLQNEEKSFSFGKAAYARVIEIFSIKRWCKSMLSIYTEVK